MTITELGAIGELVGGAAVVGTLIYLAIQVRQNSLNLQKTGKAMSASAYHNLTALILPVHATLLADRELSELIVRARAGLATLDDVDRFRFGLSASMTFHVLDDIYEYHRTGLITQSRWDEWAVTLRQNFANQGMREYWAENSSGYTQGFRTLADSILESVSTN